MKEPCQCPRIIAAGEIDVKSSYADCALAACCPHSPIVDDEGVPLLTEQAPAAAFLETLRSEPDYRSWRIVGEMADWLCAMPRDRAYEVISIWKRAVERSRGTGVAQ